MLRRNFLSVVSIIFWLTLGLILSSCQAQTSSDVQARAETSSEAETARPNIVVILVDDMGFGDTGYNGSEIATPVLDQMARDGVILDRNYVYPICSPTRAALLTGRSPLEFGIDGPMSDEASLPTNLKIMPEYFKDLGYQTAMVGKWHLGIGRKAFFPHNRGFDYYYGFLGGWIDFYTHTYNEGLDWQRNGVSLREEGFATGLMSDDAVKVVQERDASKPLFLYLAYNAPHTPLQTLPADTGLNDEIPDGDRKVYAEMVTDFDAGIGKVISALRTEGILENTIIIFSSDNGGLEIAGASNGELRGGKGGALEGGMRVPGLIWWPGHIEGGQKFESMIAVHDWLPTLLDAAGGNPAVIEKPFGQNMLSALKSGNSTDRAPTVIGVVNNFAVFDGPWKLTHNTERGPQGKTTVELFNIKADPLEQNDLSSAEPEIFAKLKAMKDALPYAPSIRDTGEPPERYFRKAGTRIWDYELRIQEAREPWAEAAKD